MASEVASLRDDNASLRGELEKAQDALANLRVRYHQLLEELHLLKRRLVVAKAERLDDIADAQLAFDKLLAETQAIKKLLDDATPSDEPKDAASPPPRDKPQATRNTAPTGRRDLSKCDLPEIRIELPGTEPGARVHPEVLEAMLEVDRKPQKLTDDLARGAKMLVTIGCGEQGPVVPGLKRDDWPSRTPRASRSSACARSATTSAIASRSCFARRAGATPEMGGSVARIRGTLLSGRGNAPGRHSARIPLAMTADTTCSTCRRLRSTHRRADRR